MQDENHQNCALTNDNFTLKRFVHALTIDLKTNNITHKTNLLLYTN